MMTNNLGFVHGTECEKVIVEMHKSQLMRHECTVRFDFYFVFHPILGFRFAPRLK